jgi:CHAT domain-containing protein
VLLWRGQAYLLVGALSEGKELIDTLLRALVGLRQVDSVVYAQVVDVLAQQYWDQGEYAEAESLLKVVMGVRYRLLGKDHPAYLSALNNLASVYWIQGEYAEAERLYKAVVEIQYRILGVEHPRRLSSLNNLAVVYQDQGRYVEAESLHKAVAEMRYRVLGAEHPQYLASLNNLANVYEDEGRYVEAESLHKLVAGVMSRVLGAEHPRYLYSLNNLANVYHEQGRYAEAESLHKVVAGARYRILGPEHPDYLLSLYNLASVYRDQGRYMEAESLYKAVVEARYRILGAEHRDYLASVDNLANVYHEQGRYGEAESLHKVVAEVSHRVLGSEHPLYMASLGNLANVYHDAGRYAEAESLHRAVAVMRYHLLSAEHPHYLVSLNNLAWSYAAQGKYLLADSVWPEVMYGTFRLIRREFVGLAGAHQLAFLENNLMGRFIGFQRYVGVRGGANAALLRLGYRAARSVKGLVLSSVEGLRYLAEQSRDSVTQALYQRWLRLTQQYAALMLREDYEQARRVQKEAEAVEGELARRLPEVRSFLPDIEGEGEPELRSGEAVVEIVRVADKDTVWYLYYILTPRRRGVDIRLLVRRIGRAEEERWERVYELLRSPGAQVSGKAYEGLWASVDSVLPGGIKRVYVSPDGVYYRVNVGTLYDGRRYVIERYGVNYVASSRRLIVRKRRGEGRRSVVVGGPEFGGESPAGQPVRGSRFFLYGIPPLAGAEAEAQEVARLLGVEAVTGSAAREEAVKGAVSPRVLHIATHGYYDAGAPTGLLGSGLLFAQAAVWDSVYPPAGVEDGRLTAKEVSGMNLLGTELVVLSACETGLGEVRGEGLYGLQRAFLEAGASRVMAALWQVDDAATRAFMERFYQRWGQAGWKAETIDQAYEAVVREFKKRYRQPYYWGAFVLMR